MTTRAVVVGCGIAGLSAAAALARHTDQVVVVEQDVAGAARRGVAQARQLHNLLGRAQLHLEELFPGFHELLLRRGAARADVARETAVVEFGVVLPRRSLGLSLMCASRPLIERTLRELLPSGVSVREECRVAGLVGDHARVRGVRIDAGTLTADLVVDASGSATQADVWLRRLGCQVADVEITPVRRWYVTMAVTRPPEYEGDPTFWLCFPRPPATAACLVSPLDSTSWLVSASGSETDAWPSDVESLRRHVRRLGDGSLIVALERALPFGRPTLFQRPTVRWRRYDKLTEPPEGFLPVGDAVAALNPLLGQGMSVAAWQAALLAERLPDNAADHHRWSAEPVTAALKLSTLEERVVRDGRGRTYLAGDYLPALARAVRGDPDLHADYVRMWHLLNPADDLMKPCVVDRVLSADALHIGGTS